MKPSQYAKTTFIKRYFLFKLYTVKNVTCEEVFSKIHDICSISGFPLSKTISKLKNGLKLNKVKNMIFMKATCRYFLFFHYVK